MTLPIQHPPPPATYCVAIGRLSRSTLELLAEHEKLGLVVDGEHTGTGNTTEDVGTSTLEERLDTFGSNDLLSGIQGRLVLDGLTRGHHHTTTDSIERIRSNTSTSSDSPAESERGKEVTLKRTDEEDRLDRVVHTEVKTTVNDDTDTRDDESSVETGNSVGGDGLLVDVGETAELSLASSLLGRLVVVGETGSSVV